MAVQIHQSFGKLCEIGHMNKLKVCRPKNTPAATCRMPWEHRYGTLGTRYAQVEWKGITFGNFQADDCGKKSFAFTFNPTSADQTHPNVFKDVTWLSSAAKDARLEMIQSAGAPSNGARRCAPGAFCDGLQQMVLIDTDGTLMEHSNGGGIVVPESNPALSTNDCDARPGHIACPGVKLRMLKWEAVEDAANENRAMGSMKLWRESDERETWSSGPYICDCMDCKPEGHIRHFMAKANDNLNLTLFVSPPKHHRLFYFNDDEDKIRVAMRFAQPFRFEFYSDGEKLPEATYDTSQFEPARLPTQEDKHGSFAFHPHHRTLYFTLKGGTYDGRPATRGGGFIVIRQLLVVQLTLAVSTELENFDNKALVKHLGLLLKIDPARIKVVNVQSAAQVAAQEGGRRLAAGGTEIVAQISEPAPPMPAESFADALPGASVTQTFTPAPDDTSAPASTGTETPGSTTTAPPSFDESALQELQQLASKVQAAVDDGSLGDAIGAEVVLKEILTTDPTAAAVDINETKTDSLTDDAKAVVSVLTSTRKSILAVVLGLVFGVVLGATCGACVWYVGKKHLHQKVTASCNTPVTPAMDTADSIGGRSPAGNDVQVNIEG
eukprot:TRINITY_DN21836_c0_g1_i1.p1 TRINITY_DN21836_c0_g1~~TRINITY_DN21836_c0_g1_i1.p1  ORF type:complete len:608 (-),score=142.49 TRINITY_DN21836_c0_g1_i1:128-1951(-)